MKMGRGMRFIYPMKYGRSCSDNSKLVIVGEINRKFGW
jgi:hypothetical protein